MEIYEILLCDFNGEKIDETFYGKELQKTSQKELRIQNIIKIKGDRVYIKWKGYDNSFSSLINVQDIV